MLKVLLVLTLIAECAVVPAFLHFYWPTKNKYSLATKIMASVLFVLCGVLAARISGNNTLYANLILFGLIFGAIGDLLLHSLSNKMWHFVLGVISFLVGHIFYIAAFQKAIKATYPGDPFFKWYEFVILAVTTAVVLVYCFVKNKFKKQPLKAAGLCVYSVFLSYMFAKGVRYFIGEIAYGTNDHMVMVGITVVLGALLFLVSDAILGYIIANGDAKRSQRIVNIVTYYAAQILIALSIFFVKSRELY